MDQHLSEKKYPKASIEIAEMLNLPTSDAEEPTDQPTSRPVAGLPVVEAHPTKPAPKLEEKTVPNTYAHAPEQPVEEKPRGGGLNLLKAALPYLAVFIVAVFLYYFFFSNTNFSLNLSGLFKSAPKIAQTSKQSALAGLEKSDSQNYQNWISQFYYDVSDPKILDPESDNSGNGLTNFQKYLLNLNPKSYDTLGLGQADSQTVAQGINPLTGGRLTDAQKQVLDKYFDMETVINKLTLANLRNSQNVAGAQTGGAFNAATSTSAVVPGVAPRGQQGAASVAPVNAADVEIDTSKPGRLEIPSLSVNVPLIWSDDTKNFDRDLAKGVIHYPGTALPGQIGTSYISGHSSNYVWASGDYNHIFTQLDKLGQGSDFKITVVQKNGKDAVLHYIVTNSQEYKPTDASQFANGPKSVVALSTCWPVGSTANRLVAFGELVQVEKK